MAKVTKVTRVRGVNDRQRPRLELTSEVRMAERRVRVSELYLQGLTQREVAKELGITEMTVSHDLKSIQETWMEFVGLNYDSLLAKELAKIDMVIKEGWLAWNQLKGTKVHWKKIQEKVPTTKRFDVKTGKWVPMTEEEIKKAPLRVVREVVEEVSNQGQGNPALLKAILDAIQLRCKLLGLFNGKADGEGGDNKQRLDWDAMTRPPRQIDVVEEAVKLLPQGTQNQPQGY